MISLLLFTIIAFPSGLIHRTVIHECKYKITFTATDSHGATDSETITITVNRPVNLHRICKYWLKVPSNDGADLNEDGIVNLKDYAIWANGVE